MALTEGPDLDVVDEGAVGRGPALKKRMRARGLEIVDLVEEIQKRGGELSREYAGQVLLGKHPDSPKLDLIEATLDALDEENARRGEPVIASATADDQVTLVAEGIRGIARITSTGMPAAAAQALADAVDRILRGESPDEEV